MPSANRAKSTFSVRLPRSYLDWMLIACIIASCATMVILLAQTNPGVFVLYWNPYSLISAAGFITNLALLVMLFRRPMYALPLLWLAVFIITNLLWGASVSYT